MSRTRIVKGNITKIIGGDYKRYSKDNVENIGSKVIQIGKENGVSYSNAEKFVLKDGVYEAILFPNILLTSTNVLASIEIISGKIISDNDIVEINNEKIDYWRASNRKIYFIPKDNFSSVTMKKESEEYIFLNKPETADGIKDVTLSLDKQLLLLRKASKERFNFGGKSNQYRKDQILTEGYYRFQKALEFIESKYTSEQDVEYFINWLNKNT